MKIGIVTFHFAYNYGAVLQAWALMTYLKSQGHDVEIVDYRPKYHTERYAVHRSLKLSVMATHQRYGFSPFRMGRAVAGTFIDNLKYRKIRVLKQSLFEDFFAKNYCLSPGFNNITDLQAATLKYDVLIAGSDQIWNKKLTNNAFDSAYFLNFGDPTCKRILYGVSIGETPINECISFESSMSLPIDSYSCRENDDSLDIARLVKTECAHVCDPTLLLNAKTYQPIECVNFKTKGDYILVYILKENDSLNRCIKEFLNNGDAVINISPISLNIGGGKTLYPVSPSEFLSYIKNACYIITNSFHGTVFSILYQKQFICGLHGTRNKRIYSLLSQLNLDNRVLRNVEDLKLLINTPIDYSLVKPMLSALSKTGGDYLNDCLSYDE